MSQTREQEAQDRLSDHPPEVVSDALRKSWAESFGGTNEALIEAARKYLYSHGLPHPTNVTEVLGLRDLYALNMARITFADTAKDPGRKEESHSGWGSDSDVSTVGKVMRLAVPHLWNSDLFLSACSIRLPEHIVDIHLPWPILWLTFDRKLKWFPGLGFEHQVEDGKETLTGEDALECVGVLVMQGVGTLGAYFIRGAMDQSTVIYPKKLKQGAKYPEEVDPCWRALLSALSFMESPYILRTSRAMNRGDRKRFNLGSFEEQLPQNMLHFIDLRARGSEESVGKEEHEHGIDWKCRWIVRCHPRNQWYPSEEKHKIIWIAPYVKGPDDAPLKVSAYRVNR